MVTPALDPLDVLAGTLAQVEEAAQVLPVPVDGGEAHAAHQTLPLGVEVVLPRELVKVLLQGKFILR